MVRYGLKTAYRDGTTHVVFERGGLPPLEFMAKLAALVPRPRTKLTRFHGVLAPVLVAPDEDCASRIIVGMPNHSIEDPCIIGKILSHLEAMFGSQGPENRRPRARAPPAAVC